ncbi:MAG: regulatory protein RecX [Fusobacteriaceae bacterium]
MNKKSFEDQKKEFEAKLLADPDKIKAGAKNYAIYLLAKKDYFKSDLETKIMSKYPDKKIIEDIIFELEKKGYINDDDIAKNYIYSHKKYGRVKLEFELRRKKIDIQLIKDLLEQNHENELDELKRLIAGFGEEKKSQKAINSLIRKGFKLDDILKIIGGDVNC